MLVVVLLRLCLDPVASGSFSSSRARRWHFCRGVVSAASFAGRNGAACPKRARAAARGSGGVGAPCVDLMPPRNTIDHRGFDGGLRVRA